LSLARRAKEERAAPERPADLAFFLASGESDGVTRRLISAVRDGSHSLASRPEKVMMPELYTLRRMSAYSDSGGGN